VFRLYNSVTRRVEQFQPSATPVGMYSCGPTVYSYPHLGNMRTYVFADTLRRALRWKGFGVRHVVNITDVGHAVADSDTGLDKMEVAAARERRSVEEIAAHYTEAFFADLAALNVLPADEYPRASAWVDQMIAFAARLESLGYAYQLPSGLYFDTGKLSSYGALALINAGGQRGGHLDGRRLATDFALWRADEPGQRRIMRWESPWGPGVPGWHLECSVMSTALLGEHFDIHTGGVDHRELHHVNEIAQSEAYLGDGRPWVRYWLHGEFLRLGAQRMAKSAGGAPRLADLTEAGYHPMAFRLFLLGSHYRSQLDFTPAVMDTAQATLRRLVTRIAPLRSLAPQGPLVARGNPGPLVAHGNPDPVAACLLDQIDAAVSADLATPRILATLHDALREPALSQAGLRAVVAECDELLGLGLARLDAADLARGRRAIGDLQSADLQSADLQSIGQLVADRTQARKGKDWARADRIRAELDRLGVQVTDTPDGPVWEFR